MQMRMIRNTIYKQVVNPVDVGQFWVFKTGMVGPHSPNIQRKHVLLSVLTIT